MTTLIHIGYQKTGTSWLQTHLFRREDLGFVSPLGRYDIVENLVFPRPLDFDAEACRARFADPIRAARGRGLVPVVTHERLCGNPHSGGYDSKEVAGRLAGVFPGAKVLMVVREQRDMIVSTYKQYVWVGGPCPLRDYLNPPERRRVPLFDYDHFAYDRLARHYAALFGRANVLVLPFELLRTRPERFVEPIAAFAGVPAAPDGLPFDLVQNPGLSGAMTAVKRRLNPWAVRDSVCPYGPVRIPGLDLLLRRGLHRADRAIPRGLRRRFDRRLRAEVAARVGDRYRDSNRRLAELVGVDLGDLGYDV